ncbi:MAG: phosphoribosylamine--glycine ligase [Victivallales bacterium]|jgi:phosphoribosylamine---glycine ligase|nr:phosphoribosylamine--glycine ligase [Victivallales bacterium]
MKVLVVGGGGREHALVWKLQQSPQVEQVFCAPGNPGMKDATPVALSAIDELADFAASEGIELTMVGPEVPLCDGIVDAFRAKGLRIVGPDKKAAQLEGSKSYAKEFMARHGMPTAACGVFTEAEPALAYVRGQGAPIVVKADGLAAGKGVIVAMTLAEAEEAVRDCFSGRFGEAGARVLIEECLFGEEASILALADGKTIVPLASSQDHKRLGEGDTGPNTGGMGAYSPAPVVTDELWETINREVLDRFLAGCQADGLDFRGVIYAGVMVTESGPKLLEFNVRFGDPETQAVLMRLDSDLADALVATADGKLDEVELAWSDDPAVCVVLASGGYPASYEKGLPIAGIDEAEATGAVVFHAGTKVVDGQLVNNGGRVLGVTARGADLRTAVDNAYRAVDCISWQDVCCRRDIAHRAFDR